jgi:hypothetical protein
MRLRALTMGGAGALAGAIVLAGCSSPPPADVTRFTLNNPYWDRVNVQLVVTRSSDCGNRGEGFIDSWDVVMTRNRPEVIDLPEGANVCWRRDRNPDKPETGVWTGWTKATPPPGRRAGADL